MQVALSSGGYRIIASGEAFLFGPYEDLTIKIDDGNEFQLNVVMKFAEDASGEYAINTDVENDALVMTCMNFKSLGTGLKRPTHIADVNGKPVYLMFSSSYIGDIDQRARSVKYTVFWKE